MFKQNLHTLCILLFILYSNNKPVELNKYFNFLCSRKKLFFSFEVKIDLQLVSVSFSVWLFFFYNLN